MIENRPKILNLINKLNKNKVNKTDYDNLTKKVDDNTSAINEVANSEVRVELVKQTTEQTINQYIEDGTMANLTLEDNSIETIKYKDESVTEEKIDKNLINELRYVYDEDGKKYIVKADENGNIVLNRFYEAFPNKEWVSSIKISSYEKLDYSYSHNDIKVTDDYNNEDIIGRQNGSADPYAHIDWEDGRNHIQGHVVKNCTFNRINNTFRCGITAPAGRDIVFRNNEVNNGSFSFSSETQNARIYKNIFNNVNISLASKTDCAFCGNISSTNFTTGNVLEGMQIINKDNLILNE